MPSTFESIAVWINPACLSAWGSVEYFNFDPVSFAACSAPGADLVPETCHPESRG